MSLSVYKPFSSKGIALIFFAFTSTFAFGDSSYRSKLGIDIRGLKTNAQSRLGWLGGVSMARFLGSSNASIGLAGYFGTPQGGNPSDERLWYAGVTLGYDGRMSKVFIWQTCVLVGAGSGKFSSGTQQSYYTIEPTAGIGFALGGGIRLTVNTSYIHLTDAPSFSGTSFGFRLEYKTQTQIKEINE